VVLISLQLMLHCAEVCVVEKDAREKSARRDRVSQGNTPIGFRMTS
jgi:hypothetical protein